MRHVLAFTLALGSACAHSGAPNEKPSLDGARVSPAPTNLPVGAAAATPLASQAASASTMPCETDRSCSSEQICVSGQCTAVSAALPECSGPRVQFPFNSSDLEEADKTALLRAARCLTANQTLSLTIEGNTDERGTSEYNLALGERRARAVARYLQQMGASPVQMRTISYGKDKPLCTEHDEECWAKNRHANLEVTTD